MEQHSLDTQNMAKAIYDFPVQLKDAFEIGQKFTSSETNSDIRNVVVAGMGGSAIGGDVCKALLINELTVPMVVSRNYTLPNWVNEHTLLICSSYSGNTEETLSAFEDAKAKGALICGISTGGSLTEKLKEINADMIQIPSGLQPRAALAYSVVPMLSILHSFRLIGDEVITQVGKAFNLLSEKCDTYSKEDVSNPTYLLAQKIYQTLPIIYGTTETTSIAASRMKGQLCENGDMLAYNNELPEMNHNEIVGWENNSELFNQFSVVWLTDEQDHDRVQLRQDITRKLINMKNVEQHTISVAGSNRTERFLHLIHFGDWVSYWCAILHGTDPSPVLPIEQLKADLAEKG